MSQSNLSVIKEFFGSDGYPEVTNAELVELKRSDADAIQALAGGINDGSLTYESDPAA